MKIKDIFKESKEGKLVLPDFQRSFEWNKEKQKSLLSTVISELPIGSVLILEGDRNDFSAKKMCYPQTLKTEERLEECRYLLDGQQRISSLKSFFSDPVEENDWEYVAQNMYRALNTRWFVSAKNDTTEDVLGLKELDFKGFKEYDPAEIMELLEYKQIYKKDKLEWYHPAFIPTNDLGEQLVGTLKEHEIAKMYAQEGLIPLFSLTSSQKEPLHRRVIKMIKYNRLGALKAEAESDIELLIRLLSKVKPDIQDYIDDSEIINETWTTLGVEWEQKVSNAFESLLNLEIYSIELPSNEVGRAISIFEKINEGGTDLKTFDLIVAKAARSEDLNLESLTNRVMDILAEGFTVSDELTSSLKDCDYKFFDARQMNITPENKLSNRVKEMYLNLLSMYTFSFDKQQELKLDYLKRKKILELSHEYINKNTPIVLKGFKRALAFLNYRLGIIDIDKLTYKLMILPIALLLIDDNVWNDESKLNKIEYWYWSSLFGGAYRDAQNQRVIKDISKLQNWIFDNENNPFGSLEERVLNAEGYSDKKVLLLQDENSEVKGSIRSAILQYVLSLQPKDFIKYESAHSRTFINYINAWEVSKEVYIKENKKFLLQDHHIVPLNSVTKLDESVAKLRNDDRHILNSPLNRTYISADANNRIKDKTVHTYFECLHESALRSHLLPSRIAESSNNYEDILSKRFERLEEKLKEELDYLANT